MKRVASPCTLQHHAQHCVCVYAIVLPRINTAQCANVAPCMAGLTDPDQQCSEE